MSIGYMQVSSSDERQSVALQRDALLRPEWMFSIRCMEQCWRTARGGRRLGA